MTDPVVYDTNVQEGIGDRLDPDYEVIAAARWWGVSPMEYLEWPVYWTSRGDLMRTAERRAQERKK